MNKIKMLTFTAAAVLYLGPTYAGAEGGEGTKKPTVAAHETAAAAMSSPERPNTALQTPEAGGAFFDRIDGFFEPMASTSGWGQDYPDGGFQCVEGPLGLCCYDPVYGWVCPDH
jgi:hypothetical protein